ncbi:heme-dependent peroxidase [Halobacteriales archaeon SW_7_68_16]|nr:MAG: heme-dependent peroxidase [Halobacteriales archaeon SW_7_68_16]
MDERRRAPRTEEGWYVFHDFRRIDWDAWREAPERRRERAVREGREFLAAAEAVADADDGASAVFSILGHEADLLVTHLRPTTGDVDHLARRFERTELAAFTERTYSYTATAEVSGYVSEAYFEGDEIDAGTERYMKQRLEPDLPDADHVCFYPMNKRRGPDHNWYTLPFEERRELMKSHGDVGRDHVADVTQIIGSSMGFDDYEWGVTLVADEPSAIKRLLYEMRFDPSTAKYVDFGPFYFGRRIAADDIGPLLAGEPVPGDEHGDAAPSSVADDGPPPGVTGRRDGDGAGGPPPGVVDGDGTEGSDDAESIRGELADLGIYAGQPRGEDVYAMVCYSTVEETPLQEELDGLIKNFDHYGTHVKTGLYEASVGEGDLAVVSIWETASAAETAGGFLADLPGVERRAGDDDGFATMGMFYTIKPDYREEFGETFETVADTLGGMDGHRETILYEHCDDETDTFIASRWDGKEDALEFFRSEEFRDTVQWGRDVLADRPRHVFLA